KMKKTVVLAVLFIAAVYLLPAFTPGNKKEDKSFPQNDSPASLTEDGTVYETFGEDERYDEKKTISVLVGGKTREMTLHDYLVATVAADLPASFPMAALKAQAVAARSYALYKTERGKDDEKHPEADLCDDSSHCAAFFDIKLFGKNVWGDKYEEYAERIVAAVKSTDGVIAVSDGKVIAAVFHSASCEKTEAAVTVWGSDYSYLKSVDSPGGSDSPDYYGTVTVSLSEFCKKIGEKHKNADFSSPASQWFTSAKRSEAGGVVSVVCGGVTLKGTEIREMFGLNSTNFVIEISGKEITFITKGAGHGVGMSQYGARAMALSGLSFDNIIKHYYSGVELMIKK
ncbi:MAG: stage II sporulation protein D, partial [Clostridia bacterium]|nr:stage II sporulation protein D [Clostridia bacterium]